MSNDEAKEKLKLLGEYVSSIEFVNVYSIYAILDAAAKTETILKESSVANNYVGEFHIQANWDIELNKNATSKTIQEKFKEAKYRYLYEYSSIPSCDRLEYLHLKS